MIEAERELRAMWAARGIPPERIEQMIADIAVQAAPGAHVGPFVIPSRRRLARKPQNFDTSSLPLFGTGHLQEELF